jgi:hypothetical protein
MRIASARTHAAHDVRRASRAMHVRKTVVQRSRGEGDADAAPPSESAQQPFVVVSLSPAAQRARAESIGRRPLLERSPGAGARAESIGRRPLLERSPGAGARAESKPLLERSPGAGAQAQLTLPGAHGADEEGSSGQANAADSFDAGESVAGSGDVETGPDGLTSKEEQVVRELAQRDREVRTHEAAHQAAGGALTGGATFSSETGPDGRQYAVGGEVSIEMSGGKTPEETIERAERIRAAALAPADPSPQDRAVAAAATQMEAQARQQQAAQERAEREPARHSGDGSEPARDTADAPGLRAQATAQRALAAYRNAAA